MNERRTGFLLGVVVGLGLIACGMAHAQTACGLDARNRKDVALPVIAPDAMPSALVADLHRAFDLLAIQNRGAEAKPLLEKIRANAQSAQNPCAEALAEFGLAEIRQSVD